MVTRIDLLRERFTSPLRRVLSWLLASLLPVAFGACSTTTPTRGEPQRLAGALAPSYHSSASGKKASKEEKHVEVLGEI